LPPFWRGSEKGEPAYIGQTSRPADATEGNRSPTKGLLLLTEAEPAFNRMFFRDRKDKLLTIAWNPGPEQTVVIDEIVYAFPGQSMLP
jgi:hypothetical protein